MLFLLPSQWPHGLTLFAAGVEVPDAVVEADSDGGEAQLPLQTRHQPVVQGPGPLRPDHGADGAKHASVADAFHRRLLSLNLGRGGGVTVCSQGQNQRSKRRFMRDLIVCIGSIDFERPELKVKSLVEVCEPIPEV